MSRDAFVLAAGFGTRLRPLTLHRPKPLVPVGGVPLLSYALALCARHDLRRVVVNAHHLAEQLESWRGEHEGVDVDVVTERPAILGTGGGLVNVRDRLAERFAVVNADILCDVDLTALLAAVPDGGGAMALRPLEADRYGVVAADATDTVVDLVDLAHAEAQPPVRRDTHFAGIHALHRDALDHVPPAGFACIVRSAYTTLVPQRRVHGVRHEGTWLDVGDPAAYLAANLTVLTTRIPIPLDPTPRAAYAIGPRGQHGSPPPGVRVAGSAWVGTRTRLGDDIELRNSIIGEGASIESGATLERCVVWDGARVPAGVWHDAVFHDGGMLQVPRPCSDSS